MAGENGTNWKAEMLLGRVGIGPAVTVAGAVLLVITLAGIASAGQITLEYTFERPEVRAVVIGGELYHRVILTDAPNSGNVGAPALPARGARILLPAGTEVAHVEVVPGEKTLVGRNYLVEPVARPVRLSADPSTVTIPVPDPTIYAMNRPFPAARCEEIGTYGFRGYRILTLKLHPTEYIPVSGELYYYASLRVLVETVDTDRPVPLFRELARDDGEVQTRVDNAEATATYRTSFKSSDGNFDLLIITTPELAGSFQPLKEYHDTTGVLTEIRTTVDIGSTDPDDVRAYITERYLNDGIGYVLIGADDDLIPAKNLFVRSWEGTGADIERYMPADLYFVCLDGTFNYDNNAIWGEPDDGEGGGDVDLVAEVYVGRAAVGNEVEADRFVSKTLQYLTSQGPYMRNVLMVGEHLGFGGVSEYAAWMMDEIVDGKTAHAYTTVGIPSVQFSIDRLYDRDWPNHNWPAAELITRINNGLHIINHLGHGSPPYAMKLYSSDVLNSLTNTDHCFVYSQTCLAGHFDGGDCWAEYMNIKTDYGAFALVMNARYGWGDANTTDGPSQRFDREFWDAVYNPAEAKPQLGPANQDAKEDNLYRINEPCMRWCYYESNLFGDPTVAIKEARGLTFEYPQGIPRIIAPVVPTSFAVQINGAYGGTPVPGSGQVHYRINGEDVQTGPMTETASNEYEATLPVLGCDDLLEFYLSAEETSNGRIHDPEPDSAYTVIVASEIIPIYAEDFETDGGWTVTGDATDGDWERAVPTGDGSRCDPLADFDGSGKCYLTDNGSGDADVDGGTTTLISPTFDLSVGDALISYARWYCNNAGGSGHTDIMVISVSDDDGANWTTVEIVGPEEEASGGWYEHEFKVSDFVTPTAQIRVRFDASDLGGGSIVEAAVDAFHITMYECDDCYCPRLGDWDESGSINPIDVVFMVGYVYKQRGDPPAPITFCPTPNGDWDCDDQINPVDVVRMVNYVYKSALDGLCDPCVE